MSGIRKQKNKRDIFYLHVWAPRHIVGCEVSNQQCQIYNNLNNIVLDFVKLCTFCNWMAQPSLTKL